MCDVHSYMFSSRLVFTVDVCAFVFVGLKQEIGWGGGAHLSRSCLRRPQAGHSMRGVWPQWTRRNVGWSDTQHCGTIRWLAWAVHLYTHRSLVQWCIYSSTHAWTPPNNSYTWFNFEPYADTRFSVLLHENIFFIISLFIPEVISVQTDKQGQDATGTKAKLLCPPTECTTENKGIVVQELLNSFSCINI